jgi:hypothetical protein
MVEGRSINDFTHARRGDDLVALCGKLAIAYSILRSECDSILSSVKSPWRVGLAFDQIKLKVWMPKFRKMITGACPTSEIAARFQQIVSIDFNYYRCFEH